MRREGFNTYSNNIPKTVVAKVLYSKEKEEKMRRHTQHATYSVITDKGPPIAQPPICL